jgi:hypothetical protein
MKKSFSRMKKVSICLAASVALLIGIGTATRLSAQVVGATLSGTITDTSGAVVPKAQVSIKNSATGIVHTVLTDANGLYTAPSLLPGNYLVTTSAAGFAQGTTNVTLTVGAEQVLSLSLQVGSVNQSVEVRSLVKLRL